MEQIYKSVFQFSASSKAFARGDAIGMDILVCFILMHVYLIMGEINVLSLHNHTVFHALPGVPTYEIDNSDFIFID